MIRFAPGDPVPWFRCRAADGEEFDLGAAAGRVVVLTFLGSAASPAAQAVHASFLRYRDLYDDRRALHLSVTCDPADEKLARLASRPPGLRTLFDFDGQVSQRFGVLTRSPEGRLPRYAPASCVLDPTLRVVGVFPITGRADHAAQVAGFISEALPPVQWRPSVQTGQAPMLIVPRVFELDFCRALIAGFHRAADHGSGFMVGGGDGVSRLVVDAARKRRRDVVLDDATLVEGMRARLTRRLLPELRRSFQFKATGIERFLVACEETGGELVSRPRRDNDSRDTAHRQFAVVVNLNAEEHTGGDLVFPEYGPQAYRAPTGGALVYSCWLMHESTPVSGGTRYSVQPYLFNDEGARLRADAAEGGVGEAPALEPAPLPAGLPEGATIAADPGAGVAPVDRTVARPARD